MAMKCYKCDKNSGGPRVIEFSHKGFVFSAFKNGATCPDCEAEKYKKLFDELAEGFVSGTPDNFEIDWGKFRDMRDEETKKRMTYLLYALGVFSRFAEGNWCIVGVGIGELNLNPRLPSIRLFFTKEKYAVEYARLEYAHTRYHWKIWHISEVLPKSSIVYGAFL